MLLRLSWRELELIKLSRFATPITGTSIGRGDHRLQRGKNLLVGQVAGSAKKTNASD
jgi:hypothetical protein